MTKKNKENIEHEISQINKIFDDCKPLFDLCKLKEPDLIEKIAAGSITHSFYNGIESIILLIDKNNGENIPNNTDWHKKIFERAFQNTEKRPALFKLDYKETLGNYLMFRHLYRHIYGHNIKWDKLKPLFNEMNNIWILIKNDLNEYIKNTFNDNNSN